MEWPLESLGHRHQVRAYYGYTFQQRLDDGHPTIPGTPVLRRTTGMPSELFFVPIDTMLRSLLGRIKSHKSVFRAESWQADDS